MRKQPTSKSGIADSRTEYIPIHKFSIKSYRNDESSSFSGWRLKNRATIEISNKIAKKKIVKRTILGTKTLVVDITLIGILLETISPLTVDINPTQQ